MSHRKTAFIANQLSEAVAEVIAEPEKVGKSESEIKFAAAKAPAGKPKKPKSKKTGSRRRA